MDKGQVRAAEAAELRRAELGLSQSQTGVTPRIWRLLVRKERWPESPLARARIEAHLNWQIGALTRIARGETIPEQEALEYVPAGSPHQVDEAMALLGEVAGHYRISQDSMARLKLGMVRGLVDELLKEDPNAVQ